MGRRLFCLALFGLAAIALAQTPKQHPPEPHGKFMPGETVPDGKLFKDLKSGPCSIQCLKNYAEAMHPTRPNSYLLSARTDRPAGPSEYVRYLVYLYLRSGRDAKASVLPQFVGEKGEMPVQDPGTQLAIAQAFEDLIYDKEKLDSLVEVTGAEKEAWWKMRARFERESHDAAVAANDALAFVDEAALKKRIKSRGGYEILCGMRSFRLEGYRVYKAPSETNVQRFKGYRGVHVILATLGREGAILFYDFRTRPNVPAQVDGIAPSLFKAGGRLGARYSVDTVEMVEPWRDTRLEEELVRLIPFDAILRPLMKNRITDQNHWYVKVR